MSGRISAVVVPLLVAALLFHGSADAQLHAVPITAPNSVYVMDRYSVVAPQGNGWFEMKRDKHYVYFGKKTTSRTHSFIATAISASLSEKFSSAEEFRDYVGRSLSLRGDERHTVIENRVEVDETLGRFCARYYTRAVDRNALFSDGKSLPVETHGISCLHPAVSGLSIDVSYTERGQPAAVDAGVRGEGEVFLRSLRFMPP